jgi:hypothetical protein
MGSTMNRKRTVPLGLGLSLCLAFGDADAASLSYRGQLQDGGATADGLYDLRVVLHGDRTASRPLADAQEFAAVRVRDGQFELPLEISPLLDAQPELWAELSVRDSGAQHYDTVGPRTMAKGASTCWSVDGNSGLANSAFVGTTDADPLQLRSNNQRVMQFIGTGESPTLVGGHADNLAVGVGVTIGGGGKPDDINFATDNYVTIGGGYANIAGNSNANFADAEGATISGGNDNRARAGLATIGGGALNLVDGQLGTVGGGGFNNVSAQQGTIGGGTFNEAGDTATVGGGTLNEALGLHATIPGGHGNDAAGEASFAAGFRSRALHRGAFVWADSSDDLFFDSQRQNQIRLRAAGGLMLQADDLDVDAADLGNSDPIDLVVESADAQLFLMSNATGSFGSVLAFGEMANDALVNSWSIARETSGGGNDLRFSFGNSTVAASNPAMVEFRDDGTAFKASGSASWDVISDRRLKSKIAPIENALDRLLLLRGVTFEYERDAMPDGVALPRGQQTGFVAQDVQKVFPDWVGATDDGTLFVGERGTTALMVEALRELEARNAQLEARLARLERSAERTR